MQAEGWLPLPLTVIRCHLYLDDLPGKQPVRGGKAPQGMFPVPHPVQRSSPAVTFITGSVLSRSMLPPLSWLAKPLLCAFAFAACSRRVVRTRNQVQEAGHSVLRGGWLPHQQVR